eukprot:3574411-Rhodomonas_salina.1
MSEISPTSSSSSSSTFEGELLASDEESFGGPGIESRSESSARDSDQDRLKTSRRDHVLLLSARPDHAAQPQAEDD